MFAFLRRMIDESFPPKSKFKVEEMPDLSGKVMIVTGGNTGIGYWTVKALLNKNAKVYMASRTKSRAEAAIAKLKEETGKEAIFLELNLADLDSCRKAAEDFKSKESELHVLFNSAGVMIPPLDQFTAQGYDLQFGTNVIGHYVFTKRLLPALIKGAQSSPDHKARVVNTSSSGSMYTDGIDFAILRDRPARKKAGTGKLYAYSKLGNVVFSNELARRYGDQGIVSTSLNPGNLKTELQRHVPTIGQWIMNLMMYDASYGALTQLWAGVSPETVNYNGKYLVPWARLSTPNPAVEDPTLGADFWKLMETETKE